MRLKQRIQRMITVDEGGCWLWGGYITPNGYGQIRVNRRNLGAHRVAFAEWRGEIPQGLNLDHLCRVRHCVNPDHLDPVTQAENIRRGETGGAAARTHCKHGHEFNDANTYWYFGRGTSVRLCRPCRAKEKRDRRARSRGE